MIEAGGGAARELAPGTVPSEFPESSPGGAAAGDLQRLGRPAHPWPALPAAGHEEGGAAAGGDLLPWRLPPADGARLALHGVLQQRLRDEPVPREPRLRGAVGELSLRHGLWAGVPRGAEPGRLGRQRIQRRAGGGSLPAEPARRRSRPHRPLGRLLWRLPDGARPRPRLEPVRRGGGHPRRAQLERGHPDVHRRTTPRSRTRSGSPSSRPPWPGSTAGARRCW